MAYLSKAIYINHDVCSIIFNFLPHMQLEETLLSSKLFTTPCIKFLFAKKINDRIDIENDCIFRNGQYISNLLNITNLYNLKNLLNPTEIQTHTFIGNMFFNKFTGVLKKGKNTFTYKDGKKNGEYTTYHTNGHIRVQCSFLDNCKQGLYIEFLENGHLKWITYYEHNIEHGPYTLYKNNKLYEEGTYVNNYRTGPFIIYNTKDDLQKLEILYTGIYERNLKKNIIKYEYTKNIIIEYMISEIENEILSAVEIKNGTYKIC